MKFKSKTQPLCRYCGKPIAKHTETVSVHEKQPKTTYEEPEVVQVDGKWERTGKTVTRNYAMGRYLVGSFQTKAQVQRLLNETIVSVQYNRPMRDGEPTGHKYIDKVTVWDGESYADEFYCTGEHAKAMGYAAARAGKATADYNEALLKQRAKKNGA